MNEWSEGNASLCATRQRRILNHVWPALKQDGFLIYSTCTYNRQENEEHLVEFVKGGRAKSMVLTVDHGWGIEERTTNGMASYQFFPHKVKGEGFFISAVQKIEKEEEVGIRSKRFFENPSRKITDQLTSWVNGDTVEFISQDDLVIAIPKRLEQEIEFLSKRLRVIQKGTAMATVKHDKLIPEHSFALSHVINLPHFHTHELTHEQSLAYLRKDTLTLNLEKKGFILLTHLDVPIGWVNHLGNRSNNLYPSNWRIRAVGSK
jgi:NOL1/NOP2/fmu family ribosome biogenesis protein